MKYRVDFVTNSSSSSSVIMKFFDGDNLVNSISYDIDYMTSSIKSYKSSYADIINILIATKQIKLYAENETLIKAIVEISGYNDFNIRKSINEKNKKASLTKESIDLYNQMKCLCELRDDIEIETYLEFVNHPIWGLLSISLPTRISKVTEEFKLYGSEGQFKEKTTINIKKLISKGTKNTSNQSINQIDETIIEKINSNSNSEKLAPVEEANPLTLGTNLSSSKGYKEFCPIKQNLDLDEIELIELLSEGKDDQVKEKLVNGYNWRFSFDRNVNLLHTSIIFNCNETAKFLINAGIDIMQVTSKSLLGKSVFDRNFPSQKNAFNLAELVDNIEILEILEPLNMKSNDEDKY